MQNNSIVVPTRIADGSLQFATVPSDATVQDVIQILLQITEVKAKTFGDIQSLAHGGCWALQKIMKESDGRQWDETKLKALKNGILSGSTSIGSILNVNSQNVYSSEHWHDVRPLASFTAHLSPHIRLVSLHPLLCTKVVFWRVPEIYDGFTWSVYFARTSTVDDIVASIVDELGLTKTSPIPGVGHLEYVIDEVWMDTESQKTCRLSTSSLLSKVLESPSPEAVSSSAKRVFHFCVPEEWYRWSESCKFSTDAAAGESNEDISKRLKESGKTSEDEDGTAKQRKAEEHSFEAQSTTTPSPADWRASKSQSPLRSLFSSWSQFSLQSSSSSFSTVDTSDSTSPSDRKNVSELEQQTGSSVSTASSISEIANEDDEPDLADFEQFLDEMGLKGAARTAMYALSPSRKNYLLQQNRQACSPPVSNPAARSQSRKTSHLSTDSPSTAGSFLPRLVPHLTGDLGVMKRFNINGWALSTTSPPPVSTDPTRFSGEFDKGHRGVQRRSEVEMEKMAHSLQSSQPQHTGGFWSNWWASSGGVATATSTSQDEAETPQSVKWHIEILQNARDHDAKLLKHLISLRVYLSTAKVKWMKCFVEMDGISALGDLLSTIVGKGRKRRTLSEIQITVLLEVIKCFRVLLNTQTGFNTVLSSPSIVSHIAYSLHAPSTKLRQLTAEVLAAICVLSLNDGRKTVLAALSDYQIAYDESFRFEFLVDVLRLPYQVEDYDDENFDTSNDWEVKAAFMALINALTTCSDVLEERVLLREEFSRRGLNEIIVTLRYIKPPDSLVTQLDVYTEEKIEDEQDWRESAGKAIYGAHELEGAAHCHNTASMIEEELEISRRKINELSEEKSQTRRELDQRLAEIHTLKSLLFESSNLQQSQEEGNESMHGVIQRLIQKERQVMQLQAKLDCLRAQDVPEVREADERDRSKWNILMEEISASRMQIEQMKNSLTIKNKETLYLKRAFESINSHLRTNEDKNSADDDAELTARKLIENVNKRDDEILALRAEVAHLRKRLGEKSQLGTVKALKTISASLSPPPSDPQRSSTVVLPQFDDSCHAEMITCSIVGEDNSSVTKLNTPMPLLSPNSSLHLSPSRSIFASIPPTVLSSSAIPPTPSFIASAHRSPPPPPEAPPSPPSPPSPPQSPFVLADSPPPPPPILIPLHNHGGKYRAVRPTKRLKPFFWNKITVTDVVQTVWADTTATTALDMEDLQAIFTLDDAPPTPARLTSSSKTGSVITLLDIARANNVAIMLSRIKLSFPEIRQALLELDDERLPVELLGVISRHLPTTDEISRIKDFSDPTKLAKSDQYFYQIMTIPRLAERLECMLYRQKLDMDMEEIRPDLKTLHDACNEVQSSGRFKRVLHVVLAIGNVLNESTFRGGAQGFRLDALLKLRDMRTVKGGPDCPTLLHYLAKVLMRTDLSLTTFIGDLPSIEAAARGKAGSNFEISFQTVSQSVQSLVTSLGQVKSEIQQLRQPQSGDHFVEKMQEFVGRVEDSVQALHKMSLVVESDLRSLLSYYGESLYSPEGLKPEDFFGLICSFSSALQKAALDIHETAQRTEVTKAKRVIDNASRILKSEAAVREKQISDLQTPEASQSGPNAVGRGDLDEAIRTLKEGRTRRSRPPKSIPRASKIFLDGGRPASRVISE